MLTHRDAKLKSNYEHVLSDVWSTIGTMLHECFPKDIIDVLETLESIFLVDNIASYTHVMNIAQEPGTDYRVELYSLMAQAIARIRHSVLRAHTNVYEFDHITDKELDPSDVLTYLQRARLFYSARTGSSMEIIPHINTCAKIENGVHSSQSERSGTGIVMNTGTIASVSTHEYNGQKGDSAGLSGESTDTQVQRSEVNNSQHDSTVQKDSRAGPDDPTAFTISHTTQLINYRELERSLRACCASEEFSHTVEALPELCNLDAALTRMPVSRVPSRVNQKFF